MASHNLWLRLNFPKKNVESPQVICIWYKGVFGKKQRKTNKLKSLIGMCQEQSNTNLEPK